MFEHRTLFFLKRLGKKPKKKKVAEGHHVTLLQERRTGMAVLVFLVVLIGAGADVYSNRVRAAPAFGYCCGEEVATDAVDCACASLGSRWSDFLSLCLLFSFLAAAPRFAVGLYAREGRTVHTQTRARSVGASCRRAASVFIPDERGRWETSAAKQEIKLPLRRTAHLHPAPLSRAFCFVFFFFLLFLCAWGVSCSMKGVNVAKLKEKVPHLYSDVPGFRYEILGVFWLIEVARPARQVFAPVQWSHEATPLTWEWVIGGTTTEEEQRVWANRDDFKELQRIGHVWKEDEEDQGMHPPYEYCMQPLSKRFAKKNQ